MYTTKENKLYIQGSIHVDLPYDIKQVLEASNMLVVLLEIPKMASMTENVFGIDLDGVIVWQVENIPETSIHPLLWYADMRKINEQTIRLFNWNGWAVDIDPATGVVKHRTWSK
jgi:hypothetical protein